MRAHAFAKINLTLRVLGRRSDGFHELRTVFQSVALHDTLVIERAVGPFRIVCSDPDCPQDDTNLVWRAADALARYAKRRAALRDLRVRLTKRIPLEAGLGGGSSDAAAALRLFARLWKLEPDRARLAGIAASLGADVPYFLDGGTALGLDRGDLLFALEDLPPMWVVIEVPSFGVETSDAYDWWDTSAPASLVGADPGVRLAADPRVRPAAAPRLRSAADPRVRPAVHRRQPGANPLAALVPHGDLRNDLQMPVVAQFPEIGRIIRNLERAGAEYAAMSGSGSAVFGLFRSRAAAAAAVAGSARTGRRVVLTRTVGRREYAVLANSR